MSETQANESTHPQEAPRASGEGTSPKSPPPWKGIPGVRRRVLVLALYAILIGLGATCLLMQNYPAYSAQTKEYVYHDGYRFFGWSTESSWEAGGQETSDQADVRTGGDPDRRLIFLTFLAGVAGSVIHFLQSLAYWCGTGKFEKSWSLWYVARPIIGGMLGMILFLIVRGGMFPGTITDSSPAGIIGFAALAGWFSRRTADKLAEVFDTLFRTNGNDDEATSEPVLTTVVPSPVPSDASSITLTGTGFAAGMELDIGGVRYPVGVEGTTAGRVTFESRRPPPGRHDLFLIDPAGDGSKSNTESVEFE